MREMIDGHVEGKGRGRRRKASRNPGGAARAPRKVSGIWPGGQFSRVRSHQRGPAGPIHRGSQEASRRIGRPDAPVAGPFGAGYSSWRKIYLYFLNNPSPEMAYHAAKVSACGVEGENGSQIFRD